MGNIPANLSGYRLVVAGGGVMRRLSQAQVTIAHQVSSEIAATVAPTAALLDGTARQRRDLRILARRLNGVATKYGITLEEAIKQSKRAVRPMVVTLDVADSVIEPVAVETPAVTAPAEVSPVTLAQLLAAKRTAVLRTVRGHHFALSDPRNPVNDHVCRGCGASGHFGYILDRTPCTAPYSATESLGRVA
jgi:hypothetical protein